MSLLLASATTIEAVSRYRLTPLGTIGGKGSCAYGISDSGDVVGESDYSYPFLWRSGTMSNLGSLGGVFSRAHAVNDFGQAVGYSEFPQGGSRALVWQNGSMQDLGTLGGPGSGASDINNAGIVVGGAGVQPEVSHAFFWDGEMHDLGTLGGTTSAAYAINEAGDIVGYSRTAEGQWHACIWRDGQIADLEPSISTSQAYDINNGGLVVGRCRFSNGIRACLWDALGTHDLGTIGSRASSAEAINDRGQVVGFTYDPAGHHNALLWENGTLYDLQTLLDDSGNGWMLRTAYDINNRGQIVGYGQNPARRGQREAFLPDPIPEPSCLCALASGLVLSAFVSLLGKKAKAARC